MSNPCPTPRNWWLVPIAAIGLGCASTGGMGRSAQDSEIRTIASIGDRPINVASGSPKSSAVGDLDGARTTRSRKGTVSGRVVDDRGEAIPNARVRVADGGLPGGRLVEDRTDRAGGFTLHGLRPGSTYTLIAEKQGQGGAVEGRIDVRSPETGVEIAAGAPDEAPDRRRAGDISTGRSVSERRSIDDDEEPEAPAPKYKPRKDDTPDGSDVEDIDDLAKPVSPRSRVGKVTFSGWKRSPEAVQGGQAVASSPTLPSDGDTLRASTKPDQDDPTPADPSPPRPRRARTPPPPPPEEETPDDNPLPPAIDPGSTSGPGRESRPPRAGSDSPRPSPRVSHDRTKSPGPAPGALTLAREAPEPDGPQPFSIDDQLEAEFRAAPSRPEPAPVPTLLASPAPEPTSPESTGPFDAPRPARRTTWDQLATAWDAVPKAAQPVLGPGRDLARPEAEVADSPPTLDPRPDRYRSAGRETIEACDYDPRRMQIHDFRLPDLDGRPVGLKDFDADFLLLDFWGTWCRPCLGSVPHLVELQEKYGPTSLAVVGIACEEGPASAGSAHVADVARQLGINYTVLVTSKDGQSPIQESLKVYEYPTMILIDRAGRVVWRDRGASPPVLTRLDRALSTSIRAAEAAGTTARR